MYTERLSALAVAEGGMTDARGGSLDVDVGRCRNFGGDVFLRFALPQNDRLCDSLSSQRSGGNGLDRRSVRHSDRRRNSGRPADLVQRGIIEPDGARAGEVSAVGTRHACRVPVPGQMPRRASAPRH